MLLADLDLTVLPSEVIQSLIEGMQEELARRKCVKDDYIPIRPPKPVNRPVTELIERFGFRTYEEEIAHLIALYTNDLYGIPPQGRHLKLKHRIEYLPIVLAQDWTSLFPHAKTESPTYYVYAHIDPRKRFTPLPTLEVVLKGEPFYIGKGTGQRAWDLKRNQGHGKRIQRLRDLGFPDSTLVHIIANALTERDALALEAKLIYLFGSIYNDTTKGYLLNLADHIRPVFVKAMKPLPRAHDYYAELKRKGSEAMRAENHATILSLKEPTTYEITSKTWLLEL